MDAVEVVEAGLDVGCVVVWVWELGRKELEDDDALTPLPLTPPPLPRDAAEKASANGEKGLWDGIGDAGGDAICSKGLCEEDVVSWCVTRGEQGGDFCGFCCLFCC